MTAVSLSIRRKKQSVLWSSSGLPADAYAVVAVPDKPAVLVLCLDYVVYCQQGLQYAVVTSPKGLPGQPQPKVEFTGLEPPEQVAQRAAKQYVSNVAPEVDGWGSCPSAAASLAVVAGGLLG